MTTATPVVSLPAAQQASGQIGDIVVTNDADLLDVIARGPRVLSVEQVEEITDLLAGAFAPYDIDEGETALARGLLFPELEARHAGLAAVLRRPIADWMIWLHPEQAQLVRAVFNGPLRISGAAGTGRTCVGLHRVRRLAERDGGRVLLTSFVRTLTPVYEQLYQRLSPETVDRVDIVNLHQRALRLLNERGHQVRIDGSAASTAFNVAWSRHRLTLEKVGLARDYVQEEVDHVIKGRGLASLAEYEALKRRGRRVGLDVATRQAIWLLFLDYERGLKQRGIVDFMDLLRLARDEVRREPLASAYSSVVVDEVQDLPLVGVQLCYELAGRDRPDGLTLIGDGQQSIYPGSYTLADAGIRVTGRILRTNYRNTAEILATAVGLVADEPFDDLEATPVDGRRDVESIRHGERPVTAFASTLEQHDQLLLEALRTALAQGACRASDVGLLVATNPLSSHYRRLLREHGHSVQDLYAGATDGDAVVVGTYHRGKGREFKHLLLPQAAFDSGAQSSSLEASQEKDARDKRALFVAMTRARDTLWVGVLDTRGTIPAQR